MQRRDNAAPTARSARSITKLTERIGRSRATHWIAVAIPASTSPSWLSISRGDQGEQPLGVGVAVDEVHALAELAARVTAGPGRRRCGQTGGPSVRTGACCAARARRWRQSGRERRTSKTRSCVPRAQTHDPRTPRSAACRPGAGRWRRSSQLRCRRARGGSVRAASPALATARTWPSPAGFRRSIQTGGTHCVP